MEKQIRLLDMFDAFVPENDVKELWNNAYLTAVELDAEKRMVSVSVHSENYISNKQISKIKDKIKNLISWIEEIKSELENLKSSQNSDIIYVYIQNILRK